MSKKNRKGYLSKFLVFIVLFGIMPGTNITAYAETASPGVINNTYTFQTINEDCGETAGTPVSIMVNGNITYGNSNTGIAITGLDHANGAWKYTNATNYVFDIPEDVSDSNAFVLSKDRKVMFVPNKDYFGSAQIEYHGYSGDQDMTPGIDASITGGNTDFSSEKVIATIQVNNINDKPLIKDDSNGKVIYFDGNGEYVSLDNAIDLDESFTVEMWAKWDGFQNWSRLFDFSNRIETGQVNDNDAKNVICAGVRGTTGTSFFELNNEAPTTDHRVFGNIYPQSVWTHLAFVYDHQNKKGLIYINGQLCNLNIEIGGERVRDMVVDQAVRVNNYFGRSAYDRDSLFRGNMRDVRMWNDVRSQTEIVRNMSCNLKGDEADLLALYKMDEGEGTAIENSAAALNALPDATLSTDGGAWNELTGVNSIVSTVQNTPGQLLLQISDSETNPEDLTINFASDNNGVIAASGISYAQAGDDCLLTLRPVTNAVGTAKVTITVGDGTTSVSEKFTFSVIEASAGLSGLSGTAGISGDTEYGKTLTAALTETNNTGVLSYQWVRGIEEIPGATNATYTLVQEDIGQQLRVKITSSAELGTATSAQTEVIKKADCTTAIMKPALSGKTVNSVTLAPVAGYEYIMVTGGASVETGIWQDSNIFSGLAPDTAYDFYQRVKETETHKASALSDELGVSTAPISTDWDGTMPAVDEDAVYSGGNGSQATPYQIANAEDLAQLSVNTAAGYTDGKYFIQTSNIVLNKADFTYDEDTGLVAVSNGSDVFYVGTGIKGSANGDNNTFDSNASTAGTVYLDQTGTTGAKTFALNVWQPIGPNMTYDFTGYYDGNGNTVSGIYTYEAKPQGIFGWVTNGSVKNLGIEDSFIMGNPCGAMMGKSNNTSVSNCYNTGIVATAYNSAYAAGLLGNHSSGSITDCYNTGTILGYNVGGIAGYSGGDISNCYNAGNVYGTANVGGIAGASSGGTKSHCYNLGNIVAYGNNCGGIAGQNHSMSTSNQSTIEYCYNTGSVQAVSYAGGIEGSCYFRSDYSTGNVTECYNAGNVTAISKYGGVSGGGTVSGEVTGCYYDKQLCPCPNGIGYTKSSDGTSYTESSEGAVGKTTGEMTSDQSGLAAGDAFYNWNDMSVWTFTDGIYPRLKGMESTAAAYVSVSPLFLTDGETLKEVEKGFSVSLENGVSWHSSNTDQVIMSDGSAQINGSGKVALAASKDGFSRVVSITAYRAPVPEVKPNAVIDYAKEELEGFSDDGIYTVNGDTVNVVDGAVAIESSWFGTTLSIVKKGNGTNTTNSAIQTLTIPARPEAPTEAISVTDESYPNAGDGKITGVNDSMEYSTDQKNWTEITGTELTGLDSGTYYVRKKAVEEPGYQSFASEIRTITIGAASAIPQTRPSIQINYANEELAGFGNDGIYTINGDTVNVVNGSVPVKNSWFGATLSIVNKGNGETTTDSEPQTLTMPARPSAPFSVIQAIKTENSITVINTTDYPDCEYSKDGIHWKAEAAFTNLKSNTEYTIQIRKKATGNSFPSAAIEGHFKTTENALETGAVSGMVKDENGTGISGAVVRITKQGTEGNAVDEQLTDGQGGFQFENITYGVYSLIAVKNGKTATKTVVIDQSGVVQNIVLLSGNKDTIVELSDETPPVAADNLDQMFSLEDTEISNTGMVEIKLLVEKKEEDHITSSDITTIQAKVTTGKKVGIYLDAKLLKTITGAGADNTTDEKIQPPTGKTVKITMDLPLELQNKAPYVIIRMHEGAAEILPAQYNSTLQTITFEADKFSTYAIAYTESTGSSSSSSHTSYRHYEIHAEAGNGGDVSPDGKISVRERLDKTFTITPDEGYLIEDVLVDGKSIGAVKTYTLKNVKEAHTIKALFKKESKQSNPFGDIKEGDWYYDSVLEVLSRGIMDGTSDDEFCPGFDTTRGMIAMIIYRIDGSKEKISSDFIDVGRAKYYYDAIGWAQDNGVVKGYGDGTYGPNDIITREQLVAILWRYAGSSTALDNNGLAKFSDADTITKYARSAMAWAYENGIINGKENNLLDPQGHATRAEVAQTISNYINLE